MCLEIVSQRAEPQVHQIVGARQDFLPHHWRGSLEITLRDDAALQCLHHHVSTTWGKKTLTGANDLMDLWLIWRGLLRIALRDGIAPQNLHHHLRTILSTMRQVQPSRLQAGSCLCWCLGSTSRMVGRTVLR